MSKLLLDTLLIAYCAGSTSWGYDYIIHYSFKDINNYISYSSYLFNLDSASHSSATNQL